MRTLILSCVALVASNYWLAIGQAADTQCLSVEVYLSGDDAQDSALKANVEAHLKAHAGLKVLYYNAGGKEEHKKRYAEICKFFKKPEQLPAVYVCGGLVQKPVDAAALTREMDQLTTMVVYTRTTCPHCAEAKQYLPQLQARYPGLRVVIKDIGADSFAMSEMHALAAQRGVTVSTVPDFSVCGQLLLSFDRTRLETLVQRWSGKCAEPKNAE